MRYVTKTLAAITHGLYDESNHCNIRNLLYPCTLLSHYGWSDKPPCLSERKP